MKIVFITEFKNIGGGETNLMRLALYMATKKHHITILCPKGDFSQALKKHKELNIIEENKLMCKRWINFFPLLSSIAEIETYLKDADIIHSYSINVLPLLWKFKDKVFQTIHGFWEKPYGLRGKVISKLARKVITVSQDVDKICNIPESKREQIYLGTLLPENISKDKLNKEIDILCIGRFQPIKGQDLLLKAINSCSNDLNQKVKVVFVGKVNSNDSRDIQFYEFVREFAETIDKEKVQIEFVGFQDHIEEFYEKSNLVIIPSRYESFSMVAVESLSYGVPVIVPEIGGVQEIVNDRKVGLTFKPGDANDLKSKIVSILKNEITFDYLLCQKRASEFSIQNQGNAILNIYQRVAFE